MISIKNNEDVKNLEITMASRPVIARYLSSYINSITRQYPEHSLKEFGAFFFLENREEADKHSDFCLPSPITETILEFAERIHLLNKDGDTVNILLHFCVIVADDFAVSCFVEEGVLHPTVEEYIISASVEKEVTIVL